MAPRLIPHIPRILIAGALLAAITTLASGRFESAQAQDGILSPGDAIISHFSGLTTGPTGQPLPDPNGATVRAMSLGNPGFPADGSVWPNPPLLFSLTAGDTGQVFGIALDDAEPANAYLAASSVYGLYRGPTGDGWADGMWGPGGGPGTVWKLDGANNYSPVPLSNLIGEDGTENGGAGLGGIAYDPWNGQLFVSDLETGLIHRIDTESGESLQVFDHGLDGRSYFLDIPSGQYLVLDVIPDSTETTPRFDDCTDANGAAAAFEQTPDCWNYADFRRRVYGLGVQRDPITDTIRLYYSVWGGAALGSDGWDTAGDDAATSIWSVRLDGNGGFDLTDVRREFVVPPLIPEEEGAGQFETPPVTDIVFSSDGSMLLAERGRPAPDFSAVPQALVEPDSARVLLFIRNEDGIWDSEGRYDVGFPERGPDFPPHIRANAAGGVALGDGYTDAGVVDPEAVDGTIWMSGDPLCAPNGPCMDRQTGQATVTGPIAGFQGTPVAKTSALVPTAAAQPGANASGPATQPEGPLASYMVSADDTGAVIGAMGDIAIYRSEPATQIVDVVEPTEELLEEIPEDSRVPEAPLPDIAVAKTGLGRCAPGGECQFEISITNTGPVDFYGPVILTDTIGSPGVSLVDAGPEPWFCYSADGNIFCQLPPQTLAPGESTAFTLTLGLSANHSDPRLNNCAAITWLGLPGRDRIRAVQAGLSGAGFDPGSVDGIMGPQTEAAISDAEGAGGLPQTGMITPELIDYLFGDGANQDGDASPANDQDCSMVPVDVPLPPAHLAQVSGFHRKFDSVNHDPNTSAPIDYHEPQLSFFHRTWRSSLHDVVSSQPIPIHRTALSQFHLTWGSAFHDSVYTRFVPLHSPALSNFHGSFQSILHDFRTSTRFPTHRFPLSNFHRSWNSARHDGIVTRVVPLHWVQLSAFHRRFQSGLHDRVVTRVRPIHNSALSNFHNFNLSNLHDPLTSRVRPIHLPGISTFHRNAISALHNRATSNRRPGHINNISNFHRTFVSAQHVPLTTRMRPIHNPGLSNFHRNNPSAMHNGRTTQRISQHLGALSRFHRNNASGVHNRVTSLSRPIHAQGVSNFHRSGTSRLHNASTSRAAPIHAPAISNFHRNKNSGQHQNRTSNALPPAHNVGLSNFHRSGKSGQHNNRSSAGVSPAHQPAISSFHRNRNSGQHQPRTSGAASPAHNQNQSQAAIKPKTPAHAPAVSRAGKAPAHNAQRSNAARKPVHSTILSNATKKPGAKQPAHNQSLSNARAKPAHNAILSNATKKPPAPRKPAHNAVQSNAKKKPAAKPKQPQPKVKKPQQKKPAARKTPAPRTPVHSTVLSNAQKAQKKQPKAQPKRNQPPQNTRNAPPAASKKKHDQKKSLQQQLQQQKKKKKNK